jgi:hypothetical protein
LVVRLLTRVLVLPGAEEATRDLEILVLQQFRVLRRTAGRPKFTPLDRVLLAAASRILPGQRWTSLFLVTPQTLLRWHRELVRHKWTYPNTRKPGRLPLDPEVVMLVLRMARRTRVGAASGSAGSCASWGSGSAPPRSGRCCDEAGWARHRGAAGRAGRSS